VAPDSSAANSINRHFNFTSMSFPESTGRCRYGS